MTYNGSIFLPTQAIVILQTDAELKALPSSSSIIGAPYFSEQSGLYYFTNSLISIDSNDLIANDNGGIYKLIIPQAFLFLDSNNQISNLNVSNTLPSGYIEIGNNENIATPVPFTGAISVNNTGVTYLNNQVINNNNIQDTTITPQKLSLTNGMIIIGNSSNEGNAVTMSGDATITNTGIVTITGGTITPAKLYVPNANIIVGNSSNQGMAVVMSGDATINNTGEITIGSGTITPTKISLTNGTILIGNSSNQGSSVNMSGDATITNTGVITISSSAITPTKISLTNGTILIGNGSNQANSVSISGDATIDNTGVLTISSSAVTPDKISLTDGTILVGNSSNQGNAVYMDGDATLDDTGIITINDDAITTSKIADTNVTLTKLSLSNGKMIIGNSSGQGSAITMSGDATINSTGTLTIANNAINSNKISNSQIINSKLANSSVTLSKLSAGIAPNYINVLAGTISSSSATTSYAATVSGVLSTDICIVNLVSSTAVTFPSYGATPTSNTITINFSIAPSTFTLNYLVFRAATNS